MPVTAACVQVVPGPNRWGTPMIAPAGGSGHRAPQNNARAAPESGAITSHRRLVSSGSLTDSSWQQRCAGLASLAVFWLLCKQASGWQLSASCRIPVRSALEAHQQAPGRACRSASGAHQRRPGLMQMSGWNHSTSRTPVLQILLKASWPCCLVAVCRFSTGAGVTNSDALIQEHYTKEISNSIGPVSTMSAGSTAATQQQPSVAPTAGAADAWCRQHSQATS